MTTRGHTLKASQQTTTHFPLTSRPTEDQRNICTMHTRTHKKTHTHTRARTHARRHPGTQAGKQAHTRAPAHACTHTLTHTHLTPHYRIEHNWCLLPKISLLLDTTRGLTAGVERSVLGSSEEYKKTFEISRNSVETEDYRLTRHLTIKLRSISTPMFSACYATLA